MTIYDVFGLENSTAAASMNNRRGVSQSSVSLFSSLNITTHIQDYEYINVWMYKVQAPTIEDANKSS